MAMTLDGTTGLFSKLGTIYKAIANAEALTNITNDERAAIIEHAQEVAARYLLAYVRADVPTVETVEDALEEVVRQAIEQSESCDEPGSFSNTPSTSALTTNSYRGGITDEVRFDVSQRGARPHLWSLECVQAPALGQNHTARWQYTSTPKLPTTGATWFNGMGHQFNIGMASGQVDGAVHAPNTNILVNSGFERITSNVPDNWAVTTGTATTHVHYVATPYIGTNALRFIGDGATLIRVRQLLGDPSGSPVQLRPRTHYGIIVMARRYATGAVTGVLEIGIENAAGTAQYSSALSADVSSLTTSYAIATQEFYTGDVLSATNYAYIEMSTALGNTHEIYIDELIIAPKATIPGFGRLIWADGSASPELGDRYTGTYANDGSGTQMVMLERLFNISQYDLCMPSASGGGETILDSLSVTTPT